MRANIWNVKIGTTLLCKEESSGFTKGYFYNVEGVDLEDGWVKLIGDCGSYRSVRSNLPKFEIVDESPTMITPDKLEQLVGFQGKQLVITDSCSIKYFPVGMTTEVYAKFNAYGSGMFYYIDCDGDEALAEEFIRNFSEGNISIEVVEDKPKLKFPETFYVRYTHGEPLWMKIEYSKKHNAWGEIEADRFLWTEKDVERLLYEDKYWEMSTEAEYNKYVGIERDICTSFPLKETMQKFISKELLSIQEYLKQTGVCGLDVVISANGMFVISPDGESYECESLADVYAVIDALELLNSKRK